MAKQLNERFTSVSIPTIIDEKNILEKIFSFLKINRKYNKELQTRYYESILNSQNDKFEKIVSLIYNIANTQSQPKIDYLSEFYQKIYNNKEKLNSFENFLKLITEKNKIENNYETLYRGMLSQKGWGEKTSALFAKTIFHLHNDEYPIELKIWNDVPKKIKENDKFYLPVDAVIITIFNTIDKTVKWDFNKVNRKIKKYYKGNEIEVWDDLWFWGFITQKGSGEKRKLEWNIDKYWNLRESDKNKKMIDEIKKKANEFLKILNE